jgi:hypothetical protein
MTAKDVVIEGRYTAKVSNVVVTVQILNKSRYGGWDALNEATGRKVRIKSATKLRSIVSSPKSTNRAPLRRTRDEYKSLIKDPTKPIRPKQMPQQEAPRVIVSTPNSTPTRNQRTAKGREALAKVTAHFLNEEKDGMTLAIMYLGDFIYSSADSDGMQDDVDQIIGRLSTFLNNGK